MEGSFNEFFRGVDQMVASLERLRRAKGALLESVKENVTPSDQIGVLVERLGSINRDLVDLTVKIETLDQDILKNCVTRLPEEEERHREYLLQNELINVFLPSMIAYSLTNQEI